MKWDAAGFSLIELAIVLVIVGVILAIVGASFLSLIKGQRLSETRAVLDQAKECLLQRSFHSERYPTFTANLDCGLNDNATMDVDACLCQSGVSDAWNQPLRFIEARVLNQSAGLADKPATDDFLRDNQNRVLPSPLANVITATGETIDDVAFVLLSLGEDRAAGDPSYGNPLVGTLAATMPANTSLDFRNKGDDLYLVVTSRELARYLRQ